MAGSPTYFVNEETIPKIIDYLRGNGLDVNVVEPGRVIQPGEYYREWDVIDGEGVNIFFSVRTTEGTPLGDEEVRLELDTLCGSRGLGLLRKLADYLLANGARELVPLRMSKPLDERP